MMWNHFVGRKIDLDRSQPLIVHKHWSVENGFSIKRIDKMNFQPCWGYTIDDGKW